MKNQLFIFSKNRACQLHLLLESITKNAHNMFDRVTVLYKADGDYIKGYDKLKKTFDNVNYVDETHFKNNLINFIDDEFEFMTFLVDDAVIFKPINESKEVILSSINDSVCCFSLRLGINCVYSHPANLHYKIGHHGISNELITFDHRSQPAGDFSYPLSTDGHIYKTELLKEWLIEIPFNNPNTLEANLQHLLHKTPPLMISFEESRLVSIPINLVNDTFKNRHGLEYYMSEKELNDRYLNGEIIDLNAMDFTNINGPHKEIKYEFKQG